MVPQNKSFSTRICGVGLASKFLQVAAFEKMVFIVEFSKKTTPIFTNIHLLYFL